MNISQNKVVSLTYELKLNSNLGETVDMADASSPLIFIFGTGSMLPKFESNLENLTVNDTFEFTLDPADGYGDTLEEAIVDLPIEIFKIDGKLDEEMLKVGNFVPMQDNEGNPLEGRIINITDEKVKMDFNHPLAGKTLHFTGQIIDLRDATPDELSHGHVHGPHGHHH
ncbi:MAG: FKBP-type peptidyl-prolyl cis-trans isomerase [Chloroflexota bacterium]|jgi:FKBP-type peptidyl-prolyl cis-trans isomerase SlyD|nr:FKBP-type peptidyl-prolyl cis-trans isomerase [Lentimicrobium sp.]